jgi:hypothetical protein
MQHVEHIPSKCRVTFLLEIEPQSDSDEFFIFKMDRNPSSDLPSQGAASDTAASETAPILVWALDNA